MSPPPCRMPPLPAQYSLLLQSYNSLLQPYNKVGACRTRPRRRRSSAHQFAARIERRAGQTLRLAAFAEDFDVESAIGLGQCRRHVAKRQIAADAMSERA